jgi:hypothetical protein
LITVNWRVTDEPDAAMPAISDWRWSTCTARRASTLDAERSRPFCCDFSTTMTRCVARAVRMTWARDSPR